MENIKWIAIEDKLPEFDDFVIVKIEGLSMNASEYEDYKVLKYKKSSNCFIEWRRCKICGDVTPYKYNEPNVKKPYGFPTVTHWSYFNKVL